MPAHTIPYTTSQQRRLDWHAALADAHRLRVEFEHAESVLAEAETTRARAADAGSVAAWMTVEIERWTERIARLACACDEAASVEQAAYDRLLDDLARALIGRPVS